MARQIKRRRWARDGGVGASELVVGDGEDGLGGEGQVLADLASSMVDQSRCFKRDGWRSERGEVDEQDRRDGGDINRSGVGETAVVEETTVVRERRGEGL